MSRIYKNEALSTLPVETRHVQRWSTQSITEKGDGILLEGIVCGKARYMIIDAKGGKNRYFVLHVEVKRAHRRKFDPTGKEITPNFSQETKVSTGYLMSSYKTVPKGKTDKIEISQLPGLIYNDELVRIASKSDVKGSAGFWIAEDVIEQLDIDFGDEVRVKTKGDSAFIDQLIRIEAASKTAGNMAGDEKVGASWTDKVLANKAADKTTKEVEGVDEDEWDD